MAKKDMASTKQIYSFIMMLARRKTNVFLVGFLFMGEGSGY